MFYHVLKGKSELSAWMAPAGVSLSHGPNPCAVSEPQLKSTEIK